VQVYDWDGGGWLQRGGDLSSGALFFGYSVSISSDGNVLAIGDLLGSAFNGHVRIYAWDGDNWLQRGVNIVGDSLLDFSGFSVSLSSVGDVVAIGALKNDSNGANSGHARIFYVLGPDAFPIDSSMPVPLFWNFLNWGETKWQ